MGALTTGERERELAAALALLAAPGVGLRTGARLLEAYGRLDAALADRGRRLPPQGRPRAPLPP
ncbi:MAG: hypothetical protein D6701_05110, partial [Gemmatimonadetes bacterium]